MFVSGLRSENSYHCITHRSHLVLPTSIGKNGLSCPVKAVVLFQVVIPLKNQVGVHDPPGAETFTSQLPESVNKKKYFLLVCVCIKNQTHFISPAQDSVM